MRSGFAFMSCNNADLPAVERISARLEAAGREVWLYTRELAAGLPWQPEAAEALLNPACRCCVFFVGPTGLGDWQKREIQLALQRQVKSTSKDDPFPVIGVILPGGNPELIPGFHSLNTFIQFSRLDDEAPFHQLNRDIQGLPHDRPTKLVSAECPFRGLECFDVEHVRFFFGREGLTRELFEKLRSSLQGQGPDRFLAIVGDSGSGKSSLARAGLIAQLKKGELGGRDWPVVVCRPGLKPLENLAVAFARSLERDGGPDKLQGFIDGLTSTERALHLAARLAAGKDQRLVVLVDQFEEVFNPAIAEAARAAFIGNLLCAAGDPEGQAVVVLTMRADFYGKCAAYPRLAAAVSNHHRLVGRMSEPELRRAVEEPARIVGCEFDPGLVELLLQDVEGHPGSLPFMQYALEKLWRLREGGFRLTSSAYKQFGGLRGVVREQAARVYDLLDDDQKQIARQIFLRLIRPGGDNADPTVEPVYYRQRVPLGELKPAESSEGSFLAVIQKLSESETRLLTVEAGHGLQTGQFVEVAHEAIVKGWPLLQTWLKEDPEAGKIRDRLTERVKEWTGSGRSPTLLYSGRELARALDWAGRLGSGVTDSGRDFLTACQRRAVRAKWQVRTLVAAVIAALSAATVYSLDQSQRAQAHEKTAIEEREKADVEKVKANIARLDAENNAAQARKNADDAKGRLADGKVAQSLIHFAARSAEARGNLVQARALFQELGQPTIRADLVLWNLYLESPVPLVTILGHAGAVNCVALSADGRLALSGGEDTTVRLWDAVRGTPIRKFDDAHKLPVLSVCFTPDGRRALSGAADNMVTLWDVETGQELKRLGGHKGGVRAVCFSPDRTRALSGGDDGTVKLWDLAAGAELKSFPGHEGRVNGIAFAPDGRCALSGGADNTVKVWDLDAGAEVKTLGDHTDPVVAVAFAPDGRTALSGSWDRTLKSWDLATGKVVKTYAAPPGIRIGAVVFAADGRTAVSTDTFPAVASAAGDDARLTLWDLAGDAAPRSFSAYSNKAPTVSISADGSLILAGGTDAAVRLWHRSDPDELRVFRGHMSGVSSVACSPDGTTALSGSADKSVKVWDLATGKELATLARHTGRVHSVAFAPDGRTALSGSWDHTMKWWDLGARRELRTFPSPADLAEDDDFVAAVAYSPDGGRALYGSEDRKGLRYWDLAGGKKISTILGASPHTSGITSVAFVPNSRRALSGSSDTTLKLWDLDSGAEVRTIPSRAGPVNSVACSPDGVTALSGHADGTLRHWDLDSGKELRTLRGHLKKVTGVAFFGSARSAVSGSDDGTLKIWDLDSEKELWTLPRRHQSSVSGVASSPDGRGVLSGSWDGTVMLWDFGRIERYVEFDRVVPDAQARLAKDPGHPASLASLGNWYAFRGVHDRAADLLAQARTGGAPVSSLTLARCYWKLGRTAEARAEFRRALDQPGASEAYLNLCLNAVP